MNKTIILDISHKERPFKQDLILRQGDKASLTLDISILERGTEFDATGFDVHFMATLPNQSVLIEPCIPVNPVLGHFSYTIPSALSSVAGVIEMSYIQLAKDNEVVHSTDCFSITVRKSVDITAEEARSYLSEFFQAKATIDDIVNDGRSQTTQQQTDYESAEAQREASYETAEATRQTIFDTAETKRETIFDSIESRFTEIVSTLQGMTITKLVEGQYDESGIPTVVGIPTLLYLVPKDFENPDDGYYEWIYFGDKWERIGSTDTTITPVSLDAIDSITADDPAAGDEVLSTTGLSYLWSKIKTLVSSAVAALGAKYATFMDYEDDTLTLKAENGTSLAAVSIASGTRLAGMIQAFGGLVPQIPAGWLPCDGASYLKTDYPELYAAISDRFAPDGWTDTERFCVPDLGGRTGIGADADYALGSTGGEEKHTLTVEEMPSHKHSSNYKINAANFGDQASALSGGTGSLVAGIDTFNATTGGGQPHNNMQPYLVVSCIISVGTAFNATGDLIPAGIANGAVTEEKLSEMLKNKINFTYREEKQDTGKTTYDGFIIWGQKFKGNITIAASTLAEITLISGLPTVARLIDMWGWWCCYAAPEIDTMLVGGAWTTHYSSGGIRRSSGIIAFGSISAVARSNSAYEVYLDFTDGTLR